MKKIFHWFLMIASPLSGFAQLSVSPAALSFPETDYEVSVKKEITIQNDYAYPVEFILWSTHDDFAADSVVTLAANSSEKIDVTFTPHHNITYDEELVLISSSEFGSLAVNLIGVGKYSSYYSATFDLYEEDLKKELKSIISKGYVNLGYTGARDRMYASIDNTGGQVECVYTGRKATFNTRSGANSNSFNCEHTWPQSLFNQNEPERADIHHLFPTDAGTNSRRSNYRYAEVGAPTWSEGGSKLGPNIFEPRDEHKGDVARAMFYFVTRYQNYSSFLNNQETVLRKWEGEHPPSQLSVDRNNAIFSVQKNRNPYVDYPEFLDRITSLSSTSTAPMRIEVVPSEDDIKLQKSPTPTTYTYHLILTNTGTEKVLFNDISNAHLSVSVPNTTFELWPGTSHDLKIEVTQGTNNIADVIKLKSSTLELDIPLVVYDFSSVEGVTSKPLQFRLSDKVLSITDEVNSSVQVLNGLGQVVAFNEIQSDSTELNLNHLGSGIYFVYVLRKDSVHVVQKILIP